MGELPEPHGYLFELCEFHFPDMLDQEVKDDPSTIAVFTADQMRAYAQEAARQERERCEKDAARYRIVREGRSWEFNVVCFPDNHCSFTPEGLDDACDRAIRSRSSEG